MAKQISQHAAAAKIIRKQLKDHGIKASVRASAASMTSSVKITLTDVAPWTVKAVKEGTAQFEYGTFDGMQDMYLYDNAREDIPQVKFVFVYTEFSDELKAKAWGMICKHLGLEAVPYESRPDHIDYENTCLPNMTHWTDELIDQCLRNKQRHVPLPQFWTKPVKSIPGVAA